MRSDGAQPASARDAFEPSTSGSHRRSVLVSTVPWFKESGDRGFGGRACQKTELGSTPRTLGAACQGIFPAAWRLHPRTDLMFHYSGSRMPTLNRDWLTLLRMMADSNKGLVLDEKAKEPEEHVRAA